MSFASFDTDLQFFSSQTYFSPYHSSSDTEILSSPSHSLEFKTDINPFSNEFCLPWPSVEIDSFPDSGVPSMSEFLSSVEVPEPANSSMGSPPQPKRRRVDNMSLPIHLAVPPPTVMISQLNSIPKSTVETRPPHVPEDNLTLTREQLLTFTSEQYETLISRVERVRSLTPAEKSEIKRQRRLIKNRESAHASRRRKKSYVEELEKKISELTEENHSLKQTLHAIQHENLILKAQKDTKSSGIITSIQRGLTNSIFKTGFPTQTNDSPVLQQPHVTNPGSSQPSVKRGLGFIHKTPVSNGVVLMVILFSFGLMFGNIGFPREQQLPLSEFVIYLLPPPSPPLKPECRLSFLPIHQTTHHLFTSRV
eukprot:TRINITY_DN587_c0_g3_i2.p1 TRINITY_DN587_c0_g3~~TRINITY_DN587_c0_g3_i2.p1  ORF type:complete len:365 (+),score=39.63 TRINITY_DN587_c0_g3_i2:69-1163(+)